jgi:hypothetical protein
MMIFHNIFIFLSDFQILLIMLYRNYYDKCSHVKYREYLSHNNIQQVFMLRLIPPPLLLLPLMMMILITSKNDFNINATFIIYKAEQEKKNKINYTTRINSKQMNGREIYLKKERS